MTPIPPSRTGALALQPSTALANAPAATVRFGTAPDGLPWLLAVDRRPALDTLFRSVCSVFGVADRSALPARVYDAVADHVASGLMGVHPAALNAGTHAVYVSRRPVRALFGPTLLAQVLRAADTHTTPSARPAPPRRPYRAPLDGGAEVASVVMATALATGNDALAAAVDQAIEARQSTRHLLIDVGSGAAHTGAVGDAARVLREPRAPYARLREERLSALGDVRARFWMDGQAHLVPIDDTAALTQAFTAARLSRSSATLDFRVPLSAVVARLADLADALGALHADGRVHADLSPGNILFTAGSPEPFDSLDVPAGTPSTTATFEWAAPEQVIGQPVDPTTDVFALGRLVSRLVGGVAFGEQTHYVVPVGGRRAKTVEMLKCDGVFIDISGDDRSRAWQIAWQDCLGRCLAWRGADRPADGAAFSAELRSLLADHPLPGEVLIEGRFGDLIEMEGEPGFGRLCVD